MTIDFPSKLLTGIASIDDQHRALIHWARAVKSIGADRANRTVVVRAAQFLISYAKYHFDAEEYAMVASGYGGVAQHRREHAKMRRQLSDLSKAINNGQENVAGTLETLQDLIQEWLQNHISATDFAFARYCEQEPSARTVHLPSPKELRDSGSRVSGYEQVEEVHHAGEITSGELKSRFKIW